MIKIIKNRNEYEAALKHIEQLMDLNPDEKTKEFNDLELLSFFVSQYEEAHYSFEHPDPIEAIKFRKEQQNLNQKNLVNNTGNSNDS